MIIIIIIIIIIIHLPLSFHYVVPRMENSFLFHFILIIPYMLLAL
jgi:hypothetical protein